VLNVRTKELKKHDPSHLFLTKIPVNFNPQVDCPVIKRFLFDVLDEDQELVIQEWSGYALFPEYFIKKAMAFVGEGDTGKTTLTNVYNAFFGEQNVSVISLQQISAHKFAGSNLYKKYINVCDELSFKDINDNGAFKIATGGGIISGEKKFGDLFHFKNFAKLTFACNKFPQIKDMDDNAYFMRWIVIHFNYVIEEKDKDKQLIHKMTTPEELSGFLNFALEGLDRLFKNEKFSYDKTIDEIKAEMSRSGSSIASFADDCLEESNDQWIRKIDMHRGYAHYARSNKLPIASMKKFGGRLSKYATYTSDGRPVDPKTGKQITGNAWMNIRFKDTFTAPLPEKTDEPEQQELINDTS
jgi:putative DNA primase/helicase